MIDLHVHTTASDGEYTPTQIIEKAHALGMRAIAITDHDTVAGLAEAEKKARELKIIFLRGIELNISWQTGEFHLLGLGLKKIAPRMQEAISFLQKKRVERNEKIISNMRADGIDVTLAEVQKKFPNREIGRPHFASILVDKKKAKNTQVAFEKFLGKDKKYYEPKVGLNLDEAVIAITDCEGVPVIAHPLSLYVSWSKLPAVLQNIFERGVAGLEAYHPSAREIDCARLEALAREIGFFVTAGSDFHGEHLRTGRQLGFTSGNKPIADKFYFDELAKFRS